MPVAYDVYGSSSYVQVSSTGTSDIHTLTPPLATVGCLISADTTDARLTFDGSAPSVGAGHLVKAGQSYPWFVPVAKPIRFCSSAGSSCILSVTWLAN